MSKRNSITSSRHRIIQLLSVLVVFLSPVAIYRYMAQPPKYHAKYQTVAHRFMDLEGKYATVPDESYALLDDVITTVKSNTRYDPSITDPAKREQQLLAIFRTIDSILIDKNFIFPSGDYTTTLGEALEDHILDAKALEAALAMPHNARRVAQMKSHADEPFHLIACIPNAFLYMGVAEAMGFELKPVLLPEHMFVRAELDKNHWVNWDANRGRAITDQEYARDWGVEDWQIPEKIYLNSLTTDETLGQMYTNIAFRLRENPGAGGWGPMIDCFRKGVELNPRDYCANYGLAFWLLFNPDPSPQALATALECAQRVLRLTPNQWGAHLLQAYCFATQGQTASAVAEMHKAIDLNGGDTEANQMLPFIEAGDTTYGAFREQRPIRFWIAYEHGRLYLLAAAVAAIISGIIFRIHRRTKSVVQTIKQIVMRSPMVISG